MKFCQLRHLSEKSIFPALLDVVRAREISYRMNHCFDPVRTLESQKNPPDRPPNTHFNANRPKLSKYKSFSSVLICLFVWLLYCFLTVLVLVFDSCQIRKHPRLPTGIPSIGPERCTLTPSAINTHHVLLTFSWTATTRLISRQKSRTQLNNQYNCFFGMYTNK